MKGCSINYILGDYEIFLQQVAVNHERALSPKQGHAIPQEPSALNKVCQSHM